MKHVRLPIYDDDGFETGEMLHVSVMILEQLAKTSVIYKNHVHVQKVPTPEEEIEMVDRIISGLPPRPKHFEIDPNWADELMYSRLETPKGPLAHYRLHEDGRVEQLVKHENLEWGPPPGPWTEKDIDFNQAATRPDHWVKIPGFSRYEMSPYKAIAESETGKSVSIVKGGRIDNVLLTDDDGVVKRMSVDFLFSKTFPYH